MPDKTESNARLMSRLKISERNLGQVLVSHLFSIPMVIVHRMYVRHIMVFFKKIRQK